MEKIKVLVVDDSAVMRRAISHILESTNEMEVVGYGRSGRDAIEKIKSLNPDIVTMDIEMPVMDGLTALRHIMKTNPLPVVMVSSLTTDGAQATIEALNAGAVDFIPKNFAAIIQQNKEFIQLFVEKILYLARRTRKKHFLPEIKPAGSHIDYLIQKRGQPDKKSTRHRKIDLVLIGSSTGGPKILHQIIPQIPANFTAPILIVQHMPSYFTKSLAGRLNSISNVHVKEAEDGETIKQATVYIAPGGLQMLPEAGCDGLHMRIVDQGTEIIYKPSVDLTAKALDEHYNGHVLGVMLTGMGKDGLVGFQRLKQKGAYIIAQSMETAIIYGMPKAIVDAGVDDEVLHTEQIAPRLVQLCGGSISSPSVIH